MKRILLSVILALFAVGAAVAEDRPITVTQLPMKAQIFLKDYFSEVEVVLVSQDDDLLHKDYEVALKNGARIEFNADGEWQEGAVKCGMVPSAIVPMEIMKYVGEHYSGEHIMRIERDRRGFEVYLSNGLELQFDRQYRLIDIDD